MQAPSPHAVWTNRTRKHARVVLTTGFVALAVALAGCGGGSGTSTGAQVAAPTFGELELPDPSAASNWSTFSTSNPPAEVLPTRGRAVRLWFYAPAGSVFAVSLRDLAGTTVATLPQNSGGQPPSEAGYFEILSEDANQNPAKFHMHVRAPLALADPANYDILVVHQSLRTDVADSNPMVVALRARKVYTVTVTVTGDGKVTSSPGGITCGTSPSGHPLTDCSYEFGPGQVNLAAQGNNPNSITFQGWTGNCPPMVQTCVLTLDGTARMVANASFGAGSSPTGSTCSAAPAVSGWRWIGKPGCGPIDMLPGVTVQCDAQGYFCCSTGSPSSPRCQGQKQTAADCTNQPNQGLNARLIQPGGCYEVDSFP